MATIRNAIWGKWIFRAAITLFTIIAFYLFMALAGSIFPVNQSWNPTDDGIELFVESNGLHTGIIMPIHADIHDWSDLVRPEHLSDPSQYGSHILVGWGHAGVYRNAQYWQDLRFKDAASAVFGSDDALLHVYHLNYPQAYPHYRRSLKVSQAEYRQIALRIREQFELNAHSQPQASKGYADDDLFYKAKGHYNAFHTCNNWTSDILGQAGIRTGLWTPFQGGVMRWVPDQKRN